MSSTTTNGLREVVGEDTDHRGSFIFEEIISIWDLEFGNSDLNKNPNSFFCAFLSLFKSLFGQLRRVYRQFFAGSGLAFSQQNKFQRAG